LEAAGRFVVALGSGAEAGATFGGEAIGPGATDCPPHAHSWSGSVSPGSCGVGLASGCCGDGYAAAQTYHFQDVTVDDSASLPFLSVPMCIDLNSIA
jgi:hypothetical protein